MAELPITGLPKGQVSPSVIVCGDPARAERIAGLLDDAALLSDRREYRAYKGLYRGEDVTVCSHGVGAPGAAAAFEELIVGGAQRIIRVGTCGGLQPGIEAGHLVLAQAAVQNTGYGRELVPDGFPAVADLNLTVALQQAAASHDQHIHTGIVLTRDLFYGGVGGPAAADYHVMSEAGALAVEMECAALFLVGSLRRVGTGAILVADGNVLDAVESVDTYKPGRPVVQEGVATASMIALDALVAHR